MAKPLILLSNDDGYRAAGIRGLGVALEEYFEVVICAPDNEQSASSHSLSLNRPLRLEQHEERVFSVDGTPADSVYIALHEPQVLPQRPALVVSGMNHGLNLGQDVFYSGTVAAAREGALHGVPALAFSAHHQADAAAAARDAARLAWALYESKPASCLFNVNYPPGQGWQHRATCSGKRVYSGGVVLRSDPRGRPYYWIGGDGVHHEGHPQSDTVAFDAGIVGVTPLILDLWSSALGPAAQDLCARLAEETPH